MNQGLTRDARQQTLSSSHVGGAHILLFDGGVRFLSENVHFNADVSLGPPRTNGPADSTLERLFAIADGGVVGEF